MCAEQGMGCLKRGVGGWRLIQGLVALYLFRGTKVCEGETVTSGMFRSSMISILAEDDCLLGCWPCSFEKLTDISEVPTA
jgi:hypothetical protein